MIVFKEKTYSECEATRALYTELMRSGGQRGYWEVINQSQLPAVLKGNNVVIEKFVVTSSFFGKDRYRMYLKIGAKAKLPDQVRLAGQYCYDERLGYLNFKVTSGVPFSAGGQQPQQKEFGKKKGGGGNNGGGKFISTEFNNKYEIQVKVRKLLGEAIKYDKDSRELILEFDTIQDAIRALNILPFGLNYKIYLLDA